MAEAPVNGNASDEVTTVKTSNTQPTRRTAETLAEGAQPSVTLTAEESHLSHADAAPRSIPKERNKKKTRSGNDIGMALWKLLVHREQAAMFRDSEVCGAWFPERGPRVEDEVMEARIKETK
ncbi:hypothetical protein SODALDRAFT_382459 [Sodiomyces alkalinus F11]|uniref:Uncharacterized protein n=1 Tax=Sodiomyces alkalinus (strain CBS 110278 / VKM F-3762 / F11) TaxID=1314773 RepID=A0A3N2PJP2_SODAK|nr:hypothetical protein SODALDRAFT_382459 [Sodiomyces alkalinus F11]ROT34536.1 hypothetical protein SODALDRAFT_382459 [Sodiomyces alkalinus F11]